MSRKGEDKWRMPELERLGERFRAAETAEQAPYSDDWRRRRGSWLRRGIAGMLAILAGAAGVLELVAPAGASSPVNRAPVAAERSGSVRFTATQEITVDGRRVTSVRERGELDFVTGAFTTTLTVGETNEPIERRRIGNILYLRRRTTKPGRPARATWIVVHVDGSSLRSFSLPGGYSLIDPQVVFRVLANARSPITPVGSERLNGAPTIHYRLSTSLNAFLAAEQGRLGKRSFAFGKAAAIMNVWLDARGRPVRAEATFRARTARGLAGMKTVVDFAAYGVPVVVRPPSSIAISPRGAQGGPSALGDPVRVLERLLFPAG